MAQDEARVDLNAECKTCLYYDPIQYETDGINYEHHNGMCRRFPPRRIDGSHSGFPIVTESSWCGEYQDFVEGAI